MDSKELSVNKTELIKKAEIIYITGGERSGKSSFAQQLALGRSDKPIYLATARILDEDFEKRVARHKQDRGEKFELIEEPTQLSNHSFEGKVVVLDCVTLWLANLFFDLNENVDEALHTARTEWEKFTRQKMTLIVISNEIGMGVHAQTEAGRKFVELQGWTNQYIASVASAAWLMISGIPVTIK